MRGAPQRSEFASFKAAGRFVHAVDRPVKLVVGEGGEHRWRVYGTGASTREVRGGGQVVRVGALVVLRIHRGGGYSGDGGMHNRTGGGGGGAGAAAVGAGTTYEIVRLVTGTAEPGGVFYVDALTQAAWPPPPPSEYAAWVAALAAASGGAGSCTPEVRLADWAGPLDPSACMLARVLSLRARTPAERLDLVHVRHIMAQHSYLREALGVLARSLTAFWLQVRAHAFACAVLVLSE